MKLPPKAEFSYLGNSKLSSLRKKKKIVNIKFNPRFAMH